MAMKYICYNLYGDNRVILFDENHSHQKIAMMLEIDNSEITSAGLVEIIGDKIKVYGDSITLQRSSKEEDIVLIAQKLCG